MEDTDDREDGGEPHTFESVSFTHDQLKTALDQIQASIVLMSIPPKISALKIHRESSRLNGIKRVVSWADALRDAVNAARDEALKNPVSDSPANGKKSSKSK